jgi:hypothetical protein
MEIYGQELLLGSYKLVKNILSKEGGKWYSASVRSVYLNGVI